MLKALVIDDDKLIRWSLQEIFSQEGHHVDTVATVSDALAQAERSPYNLIFADMEIDDADSIEMLKKLQNPQIIGRPLTLEMIKHRVEEMNRGSSKKLKIVYVKDIQQKFNLGVFTLKFFPVDHAIMDAVGVILETPVATVIHPGSCPARLETWTAPPSILPN